MSTSLQSGHSGQWSPRSLHTTTACIYWPPERLISSSERIRLNRSPPVSPIPVFPRVIHESICTVYVTCVVFSGGLGREVNRTTWCRVDDANGSWDERRCSWLDDVNRCVSISTGELRTAPGEYELGHDRIVGRYTYFIQGRSDGRMSVYIYIYTLSK